MTNYREFARSLIKGNHFSSIIGERAKRARHSQVCTIENRGYIIGTCMCNFSL